MAVTLIINPGSSSKKYTLARDGRPVSTFRFERNEASYELCREHNGAEQKCEGVSATMYRSALEHMLTVAIAEGIITAATDIDRVGVRVVAPGTFFQSQRLVDEAYLAALVAREAVAPLHIPHTVSELKEVMRLLPAARIIGVSDSEFHKTMPKEAREYAIEASDTVTHDLYRFGYHGLSYASLSRQLPQLLRGHASKVVACHIGSGMSMCALRHGESIDTTMGFGPGSGLMMGTRVGDVEPAVLLELMRIHHMKPFDMQTYLQTRGGFWGQTGESDFRHLLSRYEAGDESVVAAFAQCVYRFQKTLGAYQAILGGLDAVVFTATAVERSPRLRALLLAGLEHMGVVLDDSRNDEVVSRDGIISPVGAPVMVAVVRTNEFNEILTVTQTFS
jgi:acetate kinase